MWLVLGGGFFEELLEKLRAQPDIDLLVPMDSIDTITTKAITLNVNKFELESTCQNEYERMKKQLTEKKSSGISTHQQIKLGSVSDMRLR